MNLSRTTIVFTDHHAWSARGPEPPRYQIGPRDGEPPSSRGL